MPSSSGSRSSSHERDVTNPNELRQDQEKVQKRRPSLTQKMFSGDPTYGSSSGHSKNPESVKNILPRGSTEYQQELFSGVGSGLERLGLRVSSGEPFRVEQRPGISDSEFQAPSDRTIRSMQDIITYNDIAYVGIKIEEKINKGLEDYKDDSEIKPLYEAAKGVWLANYQKAARFLQELQAFGLPGSYEHDENLLSAKKALFSTDNPLLDQALKDVLDNQWERDPHESPEFQKPPLYEKELQQFVSEFNLRKRNNQPTSRTPLYDAVRSIDRLLENDWKDKEGKTFKELYPTKVDTIKKLKENIIKLYKSFGEAPRNPLSQEQQLELMKNIDQGLEGIPENVLPGNQRLEVIYKRFFPQESQLKESKLQGGEDEKEEY